VATKDVNIDIIAKDKTQQAMKSATKGVNDLKTNVQKSVAHQQNSFNALGNTIRNVIGGVIVFQTLRFSKQMVDMASSVEEMQSKSSVVFGKFVDSVRGQLEQFGNEVGRSTHELEQMASSIQDTFVPMGFARGEASKLSIQLTKLAVDVASFNNASDTETMMAFQSALVGNHETVRRFGVVITEATLKQELLRMGINKNAKDVTNAEKVQARLNLIIAGTSDAQGDATRTSGSFANSSKALSSAIDELIVTSITPLLPALTNIVIGFTNTVKATEDFLRVIGLIPKDLSTVIKQNEEISKLYDKETEILQKLDVVVDKRAKNTLNNELRITRNLIQSIKDMQTADAQARAGKERSTVISKAMAKALQEEADAQKKLNEQKNLPMKRPDIIGFQMPTGAELMGGGLDASMTGTEQLENTTQRLNEKQIEGLKSIADMEVEIAQATADKRIEIALQTAEKEKEVRQNFINEQMALLKSGKAHEMKLEGLTAQQKEDLIINSGRSILDAMAQQNKTAFKLNKALNIAEAVMNTARGVTKALATGNIPMAVLIGVMGAVQVATIAQQKYQGRRLGGRMNQGEPYMVGEAGAELVIPDRPSNVVPNNKLGGMSQPVTVNFNISTVDARGFNELLVNSRGTIVNLINSAVNEKGKMAIV
jgi:hypothetical protein